MKTVRFYNSCLDVSTVEAQGDRPLKELIKKYGGWDVLGDSVSGDTLMRLSDIERELGIKPLIRVEVSVGFHNSSAYIVQVGEGNGKKTKRTRLGSPRQGKDREWKGREGKIMERIGRGCN